MWHLACEGWTLAGRILPAYTRDAIPCALFRPGELRVDDDAA
jgi:hypothetical protein